MSKIEIVISAYFIIGLIFALVSLRHAEKYSVTLIFVRAFIALIAWPFLLSKTN